MGWFEVTQAVLGIALGALFVGMGVLHFVPPVARGMAAMIPPGFTGPGWPSRRVLVRVTGVCEILGGLGLVAGVWLPAIGVVAGICLVLFLVAVFPANAHAARNPERFGAAATPLVPRLVGQILLGALIVVAIV